MFNLGKVKFEKVGSWENTLISCIRTLRILKTLECRYQIISKNYNVIYKTKILYKGTTISFKYSRVEYTIEVLTGLGVTDFTYKNGPISFEALEKEFIKLVDKMKAELPWTHSERLVKQLDESSYREL